MVTGFRKLAEPAGYQMDIIPLTVELGHRKIGYLSTALGSYVYQVRYASFFRSLRHNKLPAQRELSGYEYRLSECLDKHLPRLLDRGCTAVICSHDLLAHMLLIHCAELNISVPKQLSVIGFDDLPLCQYTMPPLSTVRQNRTQLGKSPFTPCPARSSRPTPARCCSTRSWWSGGPPGPRRNAGSDL